MKGVSARGFRSALLLRRSSAIGLRGKIDARYDCSPSSSRTGGIPQDHKPHEWRYGVPSQMKFGRERLEGQNVAVSLNPSSLFADDQKAASAMPNMVRCQDAVRSRCSVGQNRPRMPTLPHRAESGANILFFGRLGLERVWHFPASSRRMRCARALSDMEAGQASMRPDQYRRCCRTSVPEERPCLCVPKLSPPASARSRARHWLRQGCPCVPSAISSMPVEAR